ncbi:MAG TPA: ABC transporter permease [Gemmatimonadaceae bacterium]|nr:ABC transporter permease [Gemmatimonadaceae bacterium]
MSILNAIMARLRSAFRRRAAEERLDEEMRFHIEMQTEANVRAGMPKSEARRQAMIAFGNVEVHREAHRDGRATRTVHDLGADIRRAARTLAHARGFTLVAVLTLALGIGAAVAIFTLLDRVVLHPLAYADAGRLVDIGTRWPGIGPDTRWGISPANYFYFRNANRTLDDIGVYRTANSTLLGDGTAERVRSATVTPSLFHVLRARAEIGRLLVDADDQPRTTTGQSVLPGPAVPVAVLGYDFWVRRYGADSSVVGRSIDLDGKAVPVVGVLARGLQLPDEKVDVWLALGLDPAAPATNWHQFEAVARLRPGVPLTAVRSEFARFTARVVELFPSAYSNDFMAQTGFRFDPVWLRDLVVGHVSRALWILLASVALVLVVACFNVANLFLVRAENRRREMAVRAALGAGRARLTRTVLVECALLTGVAGIAGYAVAAAGVRVVAGIAAPWIPRIGEVRLGWESAAVTVAVTVVAALGFALISLARGGADTALLRGGGRGVTAGRHQHRVRRLLVASQMALALILLAGAGLMVRSFLNLRNVRPGLRTGGVLVADISLPRARYTEYQTAATFYRTLSQQVQGLPGVRQVAFTDVVPLEANEGCTAVFLESQPTTPDDAQPCTGATIVAPGFFDAMGIPVRGRTPTWADLDAGTGAVVVSRAFAQHYWPGQNPIGQGVRGNGWARPFYRVVGVADDVHYDGLDRPPPEMVYYPLAPIAGAPLWGVPREGAIVIRSSNTRPEELTAAVRSVLRELDPTVPMAGARSMADVVSHSTARVSFTLALLVLCATMAIVLSAVSLFGVISYIVARRAGEIGIRMALGAHSRRVTAEVMLDSLRVALAGLALGLVGALAVTRVMQSLLFDISASDPLTMALAAAVLLGVAVVASFLPARRAALVDPMLALRAE